MAGNLFLKIKTIDGQTNDSDFKADKACDISSWSWGLSNSGTKHDSTGGGGGEAYFQDITITKQVDSASPSILLGIAEGKTYDDAVITMRRAGGDAKAKTFLQIKMVDVRISSYSISGSEGDMPHENITLNFGVVNFNYTQQKADGSGATEKTFAWDIPGQKGGTTKIDAKSAD